MRTSIVILAAGVAAALTACAGPRDHINPKASYPDAGTGNVEVRQTGELVVSAPSDVPWHRASKEPYRSPHPGYVIYDERGNRVAEVHNRQFSGGEVELTHARLPAGRYLVSVDHPRESEPSVFWVTVSPGDLTWVDVESLRDTPGEPRREPAEPRVPPSE